VRKPLDAEPSPGGGFGEGKNQLRSVWLARRGELTHLEVCSSDCDVLEFGLSVCNSGKINAVLWTARQGKADGSTAMVIDGLVVVVVVWESLSGDSDAAVE
jgi:hypothetical protein